MRLLTTILSFITMLMLPTHTILAQESATYTRTHFDDHNGMSQWHVTKILQDTRGFMWFSTWNGLNRYDGYEFSVFKSQPGDGANLVSDRIRNMIMGEDGNIYCLINSRVWRFNLATYRFEDPDPEIQERYRAKMNYDTSAWDSKPMTYRGYDFEDTRQILLDTQKNAWVMLTYGVDKISSLPQLATPLPWISRDIVRCMYPDRKGRIWIATRNDKTMTLVDKDGNLLGYLGRDGRLHKERIAFGSPIYCVYQQRNGTIWMGSKPDGLFRLKETENGVFSIEQFIEGTQAEAKAGTKLNCGHIYDIKEDKRGRLFVGTQGGGINLIEKPQAQTLTFKNFSNVMKSYPQANSQVRRLKILGDTILLATTTEGFLVMQGLKKRADQMTFTVHVREANRRGSLSSSALMDMLIDRKGRLFLSTESGGVNMLLTKDLRNTKFDFEHFDTSNGMGSDATLAMTEVGDEILVQCNNQITRLNADTKVKENFNDLFFSTASRFSDAEPLLLKNGMWLLSMESGVLMIPETAFHQRIYVPRMVLTSCAIPGNPVDYAVDIKDTIVLSSKDRDITISYAALDYTDNSHIKYITRIREERHWWEGNDSVQWSVPQETRTTSLFNLSPGTYTFEVCSTNAEGLWVNNARKLTIIVEPTFWETWVAYLLYTLLFIGLVAGITYTIVYIRHLDQQREENLQAYLRLFEKTAPTSSFNEEGEADDGNAANVVNQTNAADATENKGAAQLATSAVDSQNAHIITHLNEEDDAFMRRLMEFVEKNIGDSTVGVDEMASATATSRSSLNRKMKLLLGITPADFLKEARMKRACQQLLSTNRGVNDIAYSCGFSDPKYFSKVFKATIGMSPTDYRNQ